MVRCLLACVGVLGWVVLLMACAAPLAGIVTAWSAPAQTSVSVPGGHGVLTGSVILAVVAVAGAMLLGLGPGVVLGEAVGQSRAVLTGLVLMPLLLPAQVHVYAWSLLVGTPIGPMRSAVQAGGITAGWLWPVVALTVAAAWRRDGRSVFALARLDGTAWQAAWAVLPTLRGALLASTCTVAALAVLEYAIAHLALAEVASTRLMVLIEAGAPHRQVIGLAVRLLVGVLTLLAIAGWACRGMRSWSDPDEQPAAMLPRKLSATGWVGVLGPVALTVVLPAGVMAARMRSIAVWPQAIKLFASEWWFSIGVAVLAAAVSAAVAVATIGWARCTRKAGWAWPAGLALATAVLPPALLGVGLIGAYNHAGWRGWLYDRTVVVWGLGLVGRFGWIMVVMACLGWHAGRRVLIEQARADGAGPLAVLAHVMLPTLRPTLLAAGLIIALLGAGEVVVTQLVGPVGYPSLALSLLNHMHYGRDDVVIATSLTVVVCGAVLTLSAGLLTTRGGQR